MAAYTEPKRLPAVYLAPKITQKNAVEKKMQEISFAGCPTFCMKVLVSK